MASTTKISSPSPINIDDQIRREFDYMDEEAERNSPFLKLQSGETKLLQFHSLRHEKKDWGEGEKLRFYFTVTSPNGDFEGEKELSMSPMNAMIIRDNMIAGNKKLQVKRQGSGRDTRYTFISVHN